MGRLSRLALLAALAGSLSCDEAEEWGDVIQFDPLAHRFTATRSFTSFQDGVATGSYLEELSCQGDGETFGIDLLEWNGTKRSDLADPEAVKQFDRLQELLDAGEGLRVLYQRDFHVANVDRMLQNYRILQAGGSELGASVTFWVVPMALDRSLYRVTVSLEPGEEGFPLHAQEYVLAAGKYELVAEMRVLDHEFGRAELAQTRLYPVRSRRWITPEEAEERAPFKLYWATDLPAGFALDRVEEVVQDADPALSSESSDLTLYRMIYTDGVERIEILQHAPAIHVKSASAGNTSGGPGSGIGGNPSSMLTVFLYEQDTLSIAHVALDDSTLVIESRLASSRFHDLIKGLRTR